MPAPEPAELQLGDVVKLKSGGPPMTVAAHSPTSKARVVCFWFVGGEVKEKEFSIASLEAATPARVGFAVA